MTVTDYPDHLTPQAHANAIAVTGAPLLSMATSLVSMGAPSSVPASSVFTVPGGPFSINQIGYEINVQVSAASASTFPFGTLILTWSDSVSGNTVWVDKFALCGGSAAFQKYAGTGLTKGDTLTVQYQNYDTVNAASFQMSMVQNSRVQVRDDMRQLTNTAVPGIANGNYDQDAGVLLQTSPTILAGQAQTRLIAFYSGAVTIAASINQAFAVGILMFNGAINASVGTLVFDEAITSATGGQIQAVFNLPRCQCVLQINNNGGSTATIPASVLIAEQQP